MRFAPFFIPRRADHISAICPFAFIPLGRLTKWTERFQLATIVVYDAFDSLLTAATRTIIFLSARILAPSNIHI